MLFALIQPPCTRAACIVVRSVSLTIGGSLFGSANGLAVILPDCVSHCTKHPRHNMWLNRFPTNQGVHEQINSGCKMHPVIEFCIRQRMPGCTDELLVGICRLHTASSLCCRCWACMCRNKNPQICSHSCQGSLCQDRSTGITMPAVRRCQRCFAHSSSGRRTCVLCQRRVAPGCYPERCLEMDSHWGDANNVCRDCYPSYGPAAVSRRFAEIWNIVNARGFFAGYHDDGSSNILPATTTLEAP